MTKKKRWRKFNINGMEVGIAAIIQDYQPCVQVTVIFGSENPVASISRYWDMKSLYSAQNFIDSATDADMRRAINNMQLDIIAAQKVQHLLIKYNNVTPEPEWKRYAKQIKGL
ncbi:MULTISPECIES: hypothetical protein [Photobacterium]|uniref:Uncharacterized protein n=1 Tax=Photobacterium toruni TaxID=1935446 RepID=A0A1T4UJS3_9GAMM|nr:MULTISPECIES: hypothetical protein [Photobacterium]MCD9516430.1 hypothetical protein [Photobacterium carnosum]SKA52850.1 hypothetical protein CZ814_03353 [Photobacterium toruni]